MTTPNQIALGIHVTLERTPWITGLRDTEGNVFFVTGNNGDSLHSFVVGEGPKLLACDDGLDVYFGSFNIGGQRAPQVVIAAATPIAGAHKEEYHLVFSGPTKEAWEIFHAYVNLLPVRDD